MAKATDTRFSIESTPNSYFYGQLTKGQIRLTSTVYGGDMSSEQHIDFSKADTKKILSMMTLEEFRNFCAEKDLKGLYAFIEEHNLKPSIMTI